MYHRETIFVQRASDLYHGPDSKSVALGSWRAKWAGEPLGGECLARSRANTDAPAFQTGSSWAQQPSSDEVSDTFGSRLSIREISFANVATSDTRWLRKVNGASIAPHLART